MSCRNAVVVHDFKLKNQNASFNARQNRPETTEQYFVQFNRSPIAYLISDTLANAIY